MKTIRRNTKKAKAIINNAKEVRVYSLGNCFNGSNFTNGNIPAEDCSQVAIDWITKKMEDGAKLTHSHDNFYSVTVHSNLWYEFESGELEGTSLVEVAKHPHYTHDAYNILNKQGISNAKIIKLWDLDRNDIIETATRRLREAKEAIIELDLEIDHLVGINLTLSNLEGMKK